MKVWKHITCVLYFFALGVASLWGQVRFTVDAPSSADINSEIRVVYTVYSASVSDFVGPSLADFELLSGPAVSSYSSMQSVNGRTVQASQSTSYTYILSPKQKGTFRLRPATVKVNGRIYQSPSVTIKIGGKGEKQPYPSKGRNDESTDIQRAGSKVTQRDLFFTVTTNKKKVYEQEPVVLTFKVHWKNGVGLSNVTLKQKPELKSFLSQEVELSKNLSPVIERRDGHLYRSAVNLQYVLFPQQAGAQQIPPVTFESTVIQRDLFEGDPMLTFFNGGGNISVKASRTTPALALQVLPLPSPRPAGFSGGVGHLQIKGELLTAQPKTNDVCTFRVTVTGSGNMKMLKTPVVDFPKDFDVYDPKTTDETKLTVDGLAGKVIYDYTFVPRNVGHYTIPPVELIYFDTDKDAYQTLKTAPVALNILQGKRSAEDVRHEMELRNSDIRGIHTNKVTLSSASDYYWWGTSAYLFVILVILLVYVFLWLLLQKYSKSCADIVGRKRKAAGKLSSARLRQAGKFLKEDKSEAFYAEVGSAMYNYIADRFNLRRAELTKESISALLEERKVPEETVQRFMSVINECEFARFAPAADKEAQPRLLQTAMETLEEVEEKLKSKK